MYLGDVSHDRTPGRLVSSRVCQSLFRSSHVTCKACRGSLQRLIVGRRKLQSRCNNLDHERTGHIFRGVNKSRIILLDIDRTITFYDAIDNRRSVEQK